MISVAITLGDPRGIGPEVTEAAVRRFRDERPEINLILVGPSKCDPGLTPYQEIGPWDGSEEGAGRVAGAGVRAATQLALTGAVQALVTAPIHKPALARAGMTTTGHTELLKDLAGVPAVGMLMTSNRRARSGAWSTSTLATRSTPSCSLAISSRIGVSILHGPHHSAQKSTSIGSVEELISSSKVVSERFVMAPAMVFFVFLVVGRTLGVFYTTQKPIRSRGVVNGLTTG